MLYAGRAGLSRTTFFRYFATKEDVVLGHLELLGHRLLDALVARPAAETAWPALRHAFDVLIEESTALPDQGLSMARMPAKAPSLRARQLAKELTWQDLLVPEVARRLRVTPDTPDPRPRALVAAALGCFSAAVHVWTASGGTLSLPAMLDQP